MVLVSAFTALLSLGCAARVPSAYPSHPSHPVEQRWMWSDHDVHLDVHPATGPLRGTVVLVHGGGGHGRLLAPFAEPLAHAGYRVVVPDLPGYGLTVVPRHDPPRMATWVGLVAALACEQPGPVAVYGLSLGGTVALHAAMTCPHIEAVIATTLLDLQHRGTLRAVAKQPGLVGPLLAFGPLLSGVRVQVRRLAPFDAMSIDPALNRRLADDPLIGRRRLPLGFFRSLAVTPPPTDLHSFRQPVLVAHPTQDAWTPPALSRKTWNALPGPKAWIDVPGEGHFPRTPSGRVVLDKAVLDFLAIHLAGER